MEQQEEGDKVRTGIQWVDDMKVKLISFGLDCYLQVDCLCTSNESIFSSFLLSPFQLKL